MWPASNDSSWSKSRLQGHAFFQDLLRIPVNPHCVPAAGQGIAPFRRQRAAVGETAEPDCDWYPVCQASRLFVTHHSHATQGTVRAGFPAKPSTLENHMTDVAIDLRSDTVTRPCAAMRQAMAEAEVGDDVIDVDPTVVRLEQRIAEMLGKEAAIYMPSGSMTNQIALRLHCQSGDEFLCEEGCHIYNYEQAAFAQLSGLVAQTIKGDGGLLRLEHLINRIRPIDDHLVVTRLVCLENTHNTSGGRVHGLDDVREIGAWAAAHGLRRHLDGARLFNAVAATGESAQVWSDNFDTVSVCFSKGLGAPIGSALVGPRELIQRARRARKLFGGGWRQAGIVAAGALFALENNVERLADDHARAQRLGDVVARTPALQLASLTTESNMVLFHVDAKHGTAADFVALLADKNVRAYAMGPHRVRMVTHLDVSDAQTDQACKMIEQAADEFAGRSVAQSSGPGAG